ncbi:MAG TPA: hypothetical protein VFC78_19740 [Tepidisphaeraceae bacterium]|nr:hypothetical protein [Tepidisphaeraceae bacterium]
MRRLFAILSAMSLVLCMTTSVMWMRSCFVFDSVCWMRPHRASSIDSHHGRLWFVMMWSVNGGLPRGIQIIHEPPIFDYQNYPFTWEYAGITMQRFRGMLAPSATPSHFTSTAYSVPYWEVSLLLLILPTTAALRRMLRQRAVIAGQCAHCGYDLRATPDRCPECGTAPEAKVDG